MRSCDIMSKLDEAFQAWENGESLFKLKDKFNLSYQEMDRLEDMVNNSNAGSNTLGGRSKGDTFSESYATRDNIYKDAAKKFLDNF